MWTTDEETAKEWCNITRSKLKVGDINLAALLLLLLRLRVLVSHEESEDYLSFSCCHNEATVSVLLLTRVYYRHPCVVWCGVQQWNSKRRTGLQLGLCMSSVCSCEGVGDCCWLGTDSHDDDDGNKLHVKEHRCN